MSDELEQVDEPKNKSRWFKSLLVFLLVACVTLAWLGHRAGQAHNQQAAIEWVKEMGASGDKIQIDQQSDASPFDILWQALGSEWMGRIIFFVVLPFVTVVISAVGKYKFNGLVAVLLGCVGGLLIVPPLKGNFWGLLFGFSIGIIIAVLPVGKNQSEPQSTITS